MVNETDLDNRSPVAVVGTDIVEHLMAGTDPLGKEIRLDGWTYQVIGVGDEEGQDTGAERRQLRDDSHHGMFLKQYGVAQQQHPHCRQGRERGCAAERSRR